MKLSENPDLQRLADDDGAKCPQCGKRKNPAFDLCRDCVDKHREGRGRGSGPPDRRAPSAGRKVPDNLIFETFYNEGGKLRQELFFDAPQTLAKLFQSAGLKSTALRALYNGFLSFAAALRDGRIDFDTASERFGVFHVERVVRQAKRGHLPPVVEDFMERHRALALSSRQEMLGLFRYVTNTLCYFGDKQD